MITYNNKEYRNLEEQVLKNKQDIAYHYEVDRTLANFGIKVVGVVANVSELPVPYTGDYGDAYAVGQPGDYTYYIWTRANPDLGEPAPFWLNAGKLAIDAELGTIVTVDGEKQATWNADTKLDKKPDGTVKSACYGTDYQGNNKMRGIAEGVGQAYNGALAMYVDPTTDWGKIPGGALWTATPQYDGQAANKKYVDTNTASTAKLNSISSDMNRVFGITNDGSIYNWYIGGIQGQQFSRNSFATYWLSNEVPLNIISLVSARLFTGDPNHDYHATPKKYVDSKTALYKTTILIQPDPDTQYRIFANTHKPVDATDTTFSELCESLTLPEDVAENPYNGIHNFVFGHILVNGTLRFIVDAGYDVNSDTFNIIYSVGNKTDIIQIDPYTDCASSSVKV